MNDKNVTISGTITCQPEDLELLLRHLPDHIRLTRQEPGCVEFEIDQSPDDPCTFNIAERFLDAAAFETHTARTRASEWWEKTKHIPRNITVSGQ